MDGMQIGVADLNTGWVRVGIELALDVEASFGGGVGDQVDDYLAALQMPRPYSPLHVISTLRYKPVIAWLTLHTLIGGGY